MWGPIFYSDTLTHRLPVLLTASLAAAGAGLRVSHVGYDPQFFTGTPPGTVVLEARLQVLSAVSVSAKRPLYTVTEDRLILPLGNNSLLAGNSVHAALMSLPGMVENRITRLLSLEGKPITVALLDGRSLNLTAETLVPYLASLPAGSLDRIEVITAPSSRYEASGGAVINLISVRPAGQGQQLLTQTAAGWGRYAKANTSLTHTLTRSALRMQTLYSFWYDETFYSYLFNQAYGPDRAVYGDAASPRPLAPGSATGNLVSDEYRRERTRQHLLRTRLDYTVSPRLSAGFTINGILNEEINTPTAQVVRQEAGSLETISSDTRQVRGRNSLTLSGNGVYSFAPGSGGAAKDKQTLSVDVDYVVSSQPVRSDVFFRGQGGSYGRDPAGRPVLQTGSLSVQTPQQIRIMAAKSDYSLSLKRDGGMSHQVEAGVRIAHSRFSQQPQTPLIGGMLPVENLAGKLSIPFDYRESIFSAYAEDTPSSAWLTGHGLSMRLGLRYEYTAIQTRSQGKADEQTEFRQYANLFPALNLSRTLAGGQKITFNANRRIVRPTFSFLQPSVLLLDPYTLSGGNPGLSPQYFSTLSLQYSTKTGTSLTLSYLFNRQRIIEVLQRGDPLNPVIINSYINIDRDERVSASLVRPVVVSSSVRLQGTLTAFYAHFTNTGPVQPFSNSQFSYQLQTTLQWQITPRLSADMLGRYQGRQAYGSLFFAPLGFVNAGLSYGLTKPGSAHTGKLSLNMTDLFYTQRITNGGNYASMDFTYRHRLESRRVMATLSWTLGNTKIKALPDKADTGSATEQDRANLKR